MYMKIFIYMLIIIGILTYKMWWRPKVCKEKIKHKVKEMGGEILNIEQISMREEIYAVIYVIKEKEEKAVVKFNFMDEQKWK